MAAGMVTLLASTMASAQTAPPITKRTREVRKGVYGALAGYWKGELVYRDYSTDKEVTLPTLLEMSPTPDGQTLRLHFVYDDGPGKTLDEIQTVSIDPDADTYTMQPEGKKTPRVYRVTGLDLFAKERGGTLVLLGEGTDNGKPAEIRNTLTLAGKTVTMLHEARLPGEAFRFRNRYRFTRSTKAPVSSPKFSAAQLQADFAIFKRAYEELHPGLYRYNTRAQMDAHFAALAARLSREQTLGEAYLAFAAFLTKIRCGHCYPNFYNQPDSVVSALFNGQNRVPFFFRWIDRRMIVTRNLSTDPRLVPGTEVLAINGTSTRTILDRLLTVSRADGANNAKLVSNLEVRGTSRYEAFDIYYPLLFPPKSARYQLKVRPTEKMAPIMLSVDALTYEKRLAPYKAEVEAMRSDKPLWEFKLLEDRTAYLRMPTWAVFNSKWDWKGFLDQTFEQLERDNTSALILDLRGNEGGADVGDVILSKLIREDLRLPKPFVRWVRYRKVPDDLNPYLDTWDSSFRDWGAYASDPKDGFYRMTKFDDEPSGNVIKASSRPFAGRTYVLVDASNSSATFEFARALKQSRLATLVGQPTGGSLRGINGGAFFFLRLPNTRIETDLPLVGLYPDGIRPSLTAQGDMPVPDSGIVPDILVAPHVEDIQQGVDTELSALRALLRKTNR